MGLGHDIFRACLTAAFTEFGRIAANKIADRSKPADPPAPSPEPQKKKRAPARKPRRKVARR